MSSPLVRRLLAKLQSTVLRGIVKLVDDKKSTQTVQVELRFDEIADAVELLQPFGVSFSPTLGSEVIVLSVGASQDNLVALNATDRSNRPTDVEEGEGGLYTPSGWKIFLANDDVVHLAEKNAADFVALAAKVNSELDAIRDAYDKHTHVFVATGAKSPTEVPLPLLGGPSGSVAAEKVKGT